MSKTSKAFERLTALFDGGSFTEIDPFAKSADTAPENPPVSALWDGSSV